MKADEVAGQKTPKGVAVIFTRDKDFKRNCKYGKKLMVAALGYHSATQRNNRVKNLLKLALGIGSRELKLKPTADLKTYENIYWTAEPNHVMEFRHVKPVGFS